MKLRYIGIALLCLGFLSSVGAQSKKLIRSGLNMGFQNHSSGDKKLRSVVGEVLVGRVMGGDKAIKSGFDPFPLAPMIEDGMIFIVQNDTPKVGSKPILFFEVPTAFVPQTLQVFYRRGGEQQFTAGAVTPTSSGFLPDIPANVVTERGVEYYLLFTAGNQQATFPSRDPQDNPAVLRVAVDRKSTPQPLAERTHRMISVPFAAGASTMFSQLQDDYGEYNTFNWRLFRYLNGSYVEHPNLNTPLRSGEAYWLVTADGEAYDFENGLSNNTSDAYEITLQPGWNQIANPWAFPVAWQSVLAAGLPDGPVFYDGIQYVPQADILQPYEGYWLFNPGSTARNIAIPPVEAITVAGKSGPFAIDPENEYLLQLLASSGDYLDSHNYIGLMKDASEALDEADIYEPPAVGEYLEVTILEDSMRYAASVKPPNMEGQVWELNISSNAGIGSVGLKLEEKGTLPAGFKRYVMDIERRFTYEDTENITVSLNGNNSRKLRIILGNESFASANSDGIPLVPLDFALEQNYPNPFNPETTIRYQLKEISDVRLEIYNVLGQKVRTLIDDRVDTGSHSVLWDGRNDNGVSIASGVYIYRITAGNFVKSRKMVLVR